MSVRRRAEYAAFKHISALPDDQALASSSQGGKILEQQAGGFRGVMAGASTVVQIVVVFRARTRDMLFAASLLSIGGGIRSCIASSTSRGSWRDSPGRTGSDCPDNMVLIAAHMSA